MGSAIGSGADNYYFRLTLAQFHQFLFFDFMAAEHQKAAFPFLYRAIGKNQDISVVFLAFNYYRAVGKFVYFSHEIYPSSL
jgi:hypothetical protein